MIGYIDTDKNVLAKYPYKDKSDAGIYARAIANMRSGNLDTAKTGTQTLLTRKPSNPYYYELLGDIEYQYGHYDDSIVAYEKALELFEAGEVDKKHKDIVDKCRYDLINSP